MTGAGSVLNYLKPDANKSFAVFGVGSVGLAGLMAAKIAGCYPLIAIDKIASKLELAMELGATYTINSNQTDSITSSIKSIIGSGIDYALDTTGNSKLLSELRHSMNPGAKAVGVGQGSISLSEKEIQEGKTWTEVDEGAAVPQEFIPRLIEYWSQGLFPFGRMIEYFTFHNLEMAFDALENGKVIKPVIIM